MERVGVLVISYGARATAIIDAFARSMNYQVEIYVADKQLNPFNVKMATEHVVIPDLDIQKISEFAKTHGSRIDFAIVGPERPIIEGIRDRIENHSNIPVICPTKEAAIEASKVAQRYLFEKTVPEANPRFEVFDPSRFKSREHLRKTVYKWLDELENNVVVKPDSPAAGKGVGVWGDHFTSRRSLFDHFLANLEHGKVIIEERVDGEESSFQAFCDGRHLLPLPQTRDYKRAFDGDRGPNTGGMGSYKNTRSLLPFLDTADQVKETEIVTKVFDEMRSSLQDNTALRGVPFYVAFTHTGRGPKILEINSRPGDPEIQNILPILKSDFVDLCFQMLDGNLERVELENYATVAIYKAPPTYAGYSRYFPSFVNSNEVGRPTDISKAYDLSKRLGGSLRVYPASMEIRNNEIFALKSRAVSVVGIGASIEEARQISLKGVQSIEGGSLWNRKDIASERHIRSSIRHMEELRRKNP